MLRASRGAISGAARALETAGFVRRSRRGGTGASTSASRRARSIARRGAGAIYRRLEVIAAHGIGVVADRRRPSGSASRSSTTSSRTWSASSRTCSSSTSGTGTRPAQRPSPSLPSPRPPRTSTPSPPRRPPERPINHVNHPDRTTHQVVRRAPRASSTSTWRSRPGEVFGFLGPNGAGKTTTIRTLLDLIRPTSGKAFVFDIETTEDPVAIHRRIGYIPGEFALYDRLTGGQTIEYFANLRGGVDRAYRD